MTADIICHGTPSPALFQDWLRQLETARGCGVVRYEHRPKSYGWGHFERVTWKNGRSEQRTRWSEGWKRLFYDNRCLRPSCYRCPYTVSCGRPGDFTIADFWGIENTSLASFSDSLGVSLVLINRPQGLAVLSALDVELQQSSLEDCLPRNPMLERPSTYKGKHSTVWEGIYQSGLIAVMQHERFLVSPMRFWGSRAKRAAKRIAKRLLGR